MAANGGSIVIDLDLLTNSFTQGINRATNSMNVFSNRMLRSNTMLQSSFKKLQATIIACFSLKAITDFTKSCIELGSNLQEVQNVVDVTFGEMSKNVDNFAKNAINTIGLSETVAKKYMGTFGAMAKSFGYSTEEALKMSETLTSLTGDVSSFYNLSSDVSYTKMKAVFTGETEALKELGVVMTQSALDAFAMEKGFGKTTKQMTEQEKVSLRLAFVTDKLSAAAGDFERTADGWANQTRVLSLRFEQLKATLGQSFINILTPLIKSLNTLMGHLQAAADAFLAFTSTVFGSQSTTTTTTIADDMGNIATGATETADAIDRMTDSFDELHKVGSATTSGGLAGGLLSGVTTESETVVGDDGIMNKFQDQIDNFMNSRPVRSFLSMWDSIKTTISSIANTFATMWNKGYGLEISSKLSDIWTGICEGIEGAFENFNKYWNAMSGYYDESGEELTWGELITGDILDIVEKIEELVGTIVEKIGEIVENVDWAYVFDEWHKTLEKIEKLIGNIAKLLGYTDEEAVGSILTKILAHIPEIWLACQAFKVVSWLGGIIGTVGGLTGLQGIITSISGAGGITAVAGALANSAVFWIADIALGLAGLVGALESIKGLFKTIGEMLENPPSMEDWKNGIQDYFANTPAGEFFGWKTVEEEAAMKDGKYGGSRSFDIPKLANGGYVAPNSPRLVVIGDNPRFGEVTANTGQLDDLRKSIVQDILSGFSQMQTAQAVTTSGQIVEVHIGQDKIEDLITRVIQKNNYRNGGR